MDHLAQLFGYFLICFSLSCGVAYLVTLVIRRSRRVSLADGAVLRLRCASGMYRCKLLEKTRQGWVISAPLQRDVFVPLRPGDLMTVEAADATGAFLFRSAVIARDADSHRLTIRPPADLRRVERRERPRTNKSQQVSAVLEGQQAKVVDLSAVGARVATRAQVMRGERVRLDMEGRPEPVFGWVLETLPGSDLGYDSCEVRLRFEQVLQKVSV